MMSNRKADIEPKRQRITNLEHMIEESKKQMKRLIKEMANHHEDVVVEAFRQEISPCSKNVDALINERERLIGELTNIEISEDQKDRIMDTAAKIINGLDDASFENKREVMQILDVQVTLFYDEQGKRVEVSCAIPEYDDVIMLRPSTGMLPDLARDGKPSGARFL